MGPCDHLTVSMVSQCLVCLVEHHTTDVLRRAGPPCKIILHHLWCEEEDTSRAPLLVAISRREIACVCVNEMKDMGEGWWEEREYDVSFSVSRPSYLPVISAASL